MSEAESNHQQLQQLEQELRQEKRFEKISRTLFQVSDAVCLATEPDQLYRLIHRALGSIIDTSNFYIALYDEGQDRLHFPYCIDEVDGIYPDISGMSKTSSLTAEVIRTGRPLLVKRQEMERRRAQSIFLAPACTISEVWLGVPLKVSDRAIGVMAVQSYTDPDRYSVDDLEVLVSVAGQVATAIEYKRAEDARRESEERYAAIVQQASDGIYLLDPRSKIVIDANAAFLNMIDRPRSAIGSLYVYDFVAHDESEVDRIIEQICARAGTRESGFLIGERNYRRTDGSLLTVEASATPISLGGRSILCVIVRDISERLQARHQREQLEIQLQQAQKMESIGRLAGGVAHDFNNMLSVILGHAELLLEEIADLDPLRDSISEIRKAAEHSAELTRQLLAFARKQSAAPEIIDCNQVVEGMLEMLRRLIGEEINLEWHPAESLWPVKIDPMQINQILANLCVNARDAVGAGKPGRITISTATSSSKDTPHLPADPDTAEYVCIRVEDDGQGIEPDLIQQVFEPFFTTKAPGQGTGLGLSTVYGIIKQNNGLIRVESEPGAGTAFYIYLPRHRDPDSRADQAAEAATGPLSTGETILVVEDEPAILAMCRTILEKNGYRVLTAGGPEAALSLVRTTRIPINLLLTDVMMPLMNGKELAEKIRNVSPQTRTLFMSGYSVDILINRGSDSRTRLIEKPFSARKLLAAIRETLTADEPLEKTA